MCHHKGFTLVELAIVLVIIGLIVGGVLVGRDLIHTAELRSLLTDKEKFLSGVYTFKNKYSALPGDMRNATDIWGVADPDPNTCMTAIVAGISATCDGDGNTIVGNQIVEAFYFWHHLANAGLHEGSYAWDAGTAGPDFRIWPHPDGIGNAAYLVMFITKRTVADFYFVGTYGTSWVVLGGDGTGGALTPSDMVWLEEKTDDGKPGTGTLMSQTSQASACVTTDVVATAVYDQSVTNPNCMAIWRKAF